MRAFLLLVLFACSDPPRDRLGDERVIDRLTPLLTLEDKIQYLPGERAHIKAIASDPEYREDVIVEVVSCPKLTTERDFQCLGTATEIILATATPVREDELLTFELDYDIPTDLPLSWDYNHRYQYFSEYVFIRFSHADRHTVQMAGMFVSRDYAPQMFPGFEEPPQAPMMPPPTEIVSSTGERIVLSRDKINTVIELAAGEYTFGGSVIGDLPPDTVAFGGQTFFCTKGCYAPPPPDNSINLPFATRITFQAGTEPRLYILDRQLSRFIISVR